MASCIDCVRRQTGDTDEPYRFSDSDIEEALAEAAAVLALKKISVDDTLGAKCQKLMAAISLYSTPPQTGEISSVSERGSSVSFTSKDQVIKRWQEDLDKTIDLMGSPFDCSYGNY